MASRVEKRSEELAKGEDLSSYLAPPHMNVCIVEWRAQCGGSAMS